VKITLTARQFNDLMASVLPFAGTDNMLPVLTAVHVKAHGKWLVATTTDRFRLAKRRMVKPPTDGDDATDWSEFEALIPTSAVRSIMATFKPSRGNDADLTLTIEGERLVVTSGSALFDTFDTARISYALRDGEFPKTDSIFTKALATTERGGEAAFNPKFLADFKVPGVPALRLMLGATVADPMLVTDDADFLAVLMARRIGGDRPAESWDSIFTTSDAKKSRNKASAA